MKRNTIKAYRRRKWLLLAATAMGTTFQLTACREDAALFGLRTLFSTFTLPVNTFLQDLLFAFS